MGSRSTNRTYKRLVAVAGVGLLATMAACGGSGSDDSDDDGTIVIGYSAGLSGGAAEYGEDVQNGLKLAIDEVNDLGVEVDGKKYTVKLESLDDQYDPGTTGTNVQRLVEKEGAAVVFIPHSGGIQAAQELNSGRTEFLIVAHTSDPAIVENGNPLTVMIPPSFSSYIQPFIDKVKTGKDDKLGLLATASEFGQQWTNGMIETWEAGGGEVLAKNNIDYGAVSDFAGPVAKTLSGEPDVILVGGPSQPTALIIEEARKQGFDGAFMILDQSKFENMEEFTDSENLNNSVGSLPLYMAEGGDSFISKYQEKFSTDKAVNADIGLNYQALPIMIKAMEVAGTIDDPKAIRAAMGEAIGQVDDDLKVGFYPNRITDTGHLMTDGLQSVYRTKDGKYEAFDVEQPKE